MSVASAALAMLSLLPGGLLPGGLLPGGPLAPTGSQAADLRPVALTVTAPDSAGTAPVLGGLVDGQVLRMDVDGGGSGSTGRVLQCVRTVDGFTSCRHGFPVLFDDGGVAVFQYQIRDPGRCGPADSCVVVVQITGSERVAYAYLVFGSPPPAAPMVTLTPTGPYDPGATVTVSVAGLTPGAAVEAAFCARTCREREVATADAAGTAVAVVAVGGRCTRCGVRVVTGPSDTLTRVAFTALPDPDHSPVRLAVGLVAAALLLAAATWLVRSIDWRPPSEAATPELDAATLDEGNDR